VIGRRGGGRLLTLGCILTVASLRLPCLILA
jgi:hypothetical protein